MKRELILWSMALLTLGFVSCSQDKLDNSEIGSSKPATYSLKASLEQPGDGSRTSLTVGSDGTGATQWTTGDKIFVTKDGAATTYEFAYQKMQDDLGLFKTTSNFTTGATYNYFAAYPSSMVTSMDAMYAYFNLPAVQKYSSTSAFSTDACPMVAFSSKSKFEDENLLDFKNVCGMLQLQLYSAAGTKIKSIEFTAASSTDYASGNGNSLVCYADPSSPYFFSITLGKSQTEESSPKVTLDCTTENADGVELSTDASNPTNFFIILPPQTFTGGFTLKITDSDGYSISKTKKSDAKITRSQILKMPAFDGTISACSVLEASKLNENGGIDNMEVFVGETYTVNWQYQSGDTYYYTLTITDANTYTGRYQGEATDRTSIEGVTLSNGKLSIAANTGVDTSPQCSSMGGLCNFPGYKDVVRIKCPETCGYEAATLTSISATNGGCTKTYSEVKTQIKYSAENGTVTTASQSALNGNAVAAVTAEAADGYLIFDGWYLGTTKLGESGTDANGNSYTVSGTSLTITDVQAAADYVAKFITTCDALNASTLTTGTVVDLPVAVGETYRANFQDGTGYTFYYDITITDANSYSFAIGGVTSTRTSFDGITLSNGKLTIIPITTDTETTCSTTYQALCNRPQYANLLHASCVATCGLSQNTLTSISAINANCTKTYSEVQTVYTISYSAENGTVSKESLGAIKGNAVAAVTATPSAGYDFYGWYLGTTKLGSSGTDANGNSYTVSGTSLTITNVQSNASYVAKFMKTYTITYDLGDADASVNIDNPASYAGGVGATIVPLVRQGYKFDGWTGSNGTTAQQAVTISTTDTGNKSYTANWTQITDVSKATGTYCDGTTGSPVYSFNKVYVTGSEHTFTFSNSDLGSIALSFTANESATTLSYTSNDYMEVSSATVTYQDGYYAFNIKISPKAAAADKQYYAGNIDASCSSMQSMCTNAGYAVIMNAKCPLTCQTISTSGNFKKTICSTNQDVVAKCQTFSTLCLGNAAYYVPMTEKCFSTCRIDTDPNKLTGGLTVTLE